LRSPLPCAWCNECMDASDTGHNTKGPGTKYLNAFDSSDDTIFSAKRYRTNFLLLSPGYDGLWDANPDDEDLGLLLDGDDITNFKME